MGDYLYGGSSFLTGVARSLDLFGFFDSYNVSATPIEADRRALMSDWYAIGRDIHGVMVVRKNELRERGELPLSRRDRRAAMRRERESRRAER